MFEEDRDYDTEYEFDDDETWNDFADPYGNSALRAETPDNPRDQPCPNCDRTNALTGRDVSLGYQCDRCANQAEREGY